MSEDPTCPGCRLRVELGEMRYMGRYSQGEVWHSHCWVSRPDYVDPMKTIRECREEMSRLEARFKENLDQLRAELDRPIRRRPS